MLQVLPELGEEQRVVLLQGEQAFHYRLGQGGRAGERLSTPRLASLGPSSPTSPANTGAGGRPLPRAGYCRAWHPTAGHPTRGPQKSAGTPLHPHLQELAGEQVAALPLGFLQGVGTFQLHELHERAEGQLLETGRQRGRAVRQLLTLPG